MDLSGYKFPPSPVNTSSATCFTYYQEPEPQPPQLVIYSNQQQQQLQEECDGVSNSNIEQVKHQLTATLSQYDGGEQLAQQVKEVLESAESFLQNSNTSSNSSNSPIEHYKDSISIQQQQLPDIATTNVVHTEVPRAAYESIRDLVFFIIKSPDFRAFLRDFSEFILSILSDANQIHGDEVVNTIDHDLSDVNSRMHSTRQLFTDLRGEIRNGTIGDQSLLYNAVSDIENLLMKLIDNPEYTKAVNSILLIIDEMVKRFDQSLCDDEPVRGDVFADMVIEGYQILGEFTDKSELDEFKNFFANFFEDVFQDETACRFLLDLKTILFRYMDNPMLLRTEQGRLDFSRFIKYVGTVIRTEQAIHAEQFEELFDRLIIILTGITYECESYNSSRRNSCVSDESSYDDVFVADDSMTQLRNIIIPLVKDQLQNIHLPCIEGGTNKYEFQFDNLTLSGDDILPDTFDLKFENRPGNTTTRRQVSKLTMKAEGINLSLRNVAYHYKRNRFPTIEDNGIADVTMLGTGLSFKIIWNVVARKDKPIRIDLHRVKCSIDNMDIAFKKSEHSIINKIAKKIFSRTLRKRVSEVIIDKFKQELEPLSERLNEFFRRENDSPRFREIAEEQLSQLFESAQPSDIQVAQVLNELTQNCSLDQNQELLI